MHFRSPIVWQGGEISNKILPWHFYASYDLKKYSYVTCRSEPSPSKFDTYSRQVKSMFGSEADLNTLTARQLKSTFGTKKLIKVSDTKFNKEHLRPLLCLQHWSGLILNIVKNAVLGCGSVIWISICTESAAHLSGCRVSSAGCVLTVNVVCI